jgi:ABC-type antimicrobial peptide transport system permease subunit
MITSFAQITCSPEFGETIGWQVKTGRDFSREFSRDSTAIVLNEAAADHIGLNDLVGRDIQLNGTAYKIIGIVKDILMESPWLPVKPTTFRLDSEMVNIHTVRLKSEVPIEDAIAAVQTSFNKISPSSPFEFQFVDEEFNEKFESEERIGKLSYVFAFLAIFISCLGLFGLSAFVAEQRTKEIGIRKVLGATVANLWAMQSKGFVRLVLIACLLATPLAWYFLEGWLADYDYRIELDWTVFANAAVLALVITLLTVSYQSIRAALINPVDSLKDE